MATPRTLSELGAGAAEPSGSGISDNCKEFYHKTCEVKTGDHACIEGCGHHKQGYGGGGGYWAWGFLWFIILVIIIWLILWTTKAEFVQKKDDHDECFGEVDAGKVLLWSIVIAIIIIIIIAIILAACGGWDSDY